MHTVTEIKVWDPLVRLFHWVLVAAFFIAYLSEDDWQNVHVIAGYTVLGLIALRLIWGLAGTSYARFSNFVYPPGTVLAYLKDLPDRKAARFIGHNPAGGAMIILLLLSLLVTTISGIAYYGADQWQGPLAGLLKNVDEVWIDALEEIHEFSANFTLALVVIHVLGVLGESWLHKENLVYAMIHGRKRA